MEFRADQAVLHTPTVTRLIDLALEEDLGRGDVTAAALRSSGPAEGDVVARQALVCAGLPLLARLIERSGLPLSVEGLIPEGSRTAAGEPVARISGDAGAILLLERTALNFMMRMSGVATLTRTYVDLVGDRCRLVDTRKTLPGWRALDKYAVALGGGYNHRHDLGSGVLIKDNHIAACGSVSAAVDRARRFAPHGLRVEVEVDTLAQLYEALEAGAEIVLLDNMSAEQVRQAVTQVDGKALVEVSGGVTLETVVAYADAGADVISIGALTHSAVAVDLALDLSPTRRS
jgi:nicotinate-nucleotide pyrophosphorylase (carboxylating)